MSIGINVMCKEEPHVCGYWQCLAEDFENLHRQLKNDDINISQFVYYPEWEICEEEIQDMDEDEILYMKTVTTDDYHPIKNVATVLANAMRLAHSYDDTNFFNKEYLLSDLEELIEALSKHEEQNACIQLVIG